MVENPLALQYLFTDNLYLLPRDKGLVNNPSEIELKEPDATQFIPAPATFKYTGGYQKKFLVFVHYTQQEAMEPAHLSALESTIKRKELSLDDVAILNLHQYADSAFETLMAFFNPEKMLILGERGLPAGLTPPPLNQLIKLNACNTLYTFSFGEMMGNKDNTKAFWEQMKVL